MVKSCSQSSIRNQSKSKHSKWLTIFLWWHQGLTEAVGRNPAPFSLLASCAGLNLLVWLKLFDGSLTTQLWLLKSSNGCRTRLTLDFLQKIPSDATQRRRHLSWKSKQSLLSHEVSLLPSWKSFLSVAVGGSRQAHSVTHTRSVSVSGSKTVTHHVWWSKSLKKPHDFSSFHETKNLLRLSQHSVGFWSSLSLPVNISFLLFGHKRKCLLLNTLSHI